MQKRRCLALIAGLLAFVAPALPGAQTPAAAALAQEATPAAPPVEYVGTFVWRLPGDGDFGGFSGLEMTQDGRGFYAVTDRAHLYWGHVARDAGGVIRDIEITGKAHLTDSGGRPLVPGYLGDSEDIALGADGTIWISFEGLNRVVAFDTPDSPSRPAPRIPDLKILSINEGLESLAISPDGDLLTIPENAGGPFRKFPVLRLTPGAEAWDIPWHLPPSGRWRMVGADFGPDGRLYVLQRDFRGVLGFSSRVVRFDFGADGPVNPQIVLETRPLQYDNLEGLSVWDDGQGIRISMISDDNFMFMQRTEVVEYRIVEPVAR